MIVAARRKVLLADRQLYERYIHALRPLVWLPLRETGGVIARNHIYKGSQGAELITNGAFNTDLAGWSNQSATLAWVSGRLRAITTGSNQGPFQTHAVNPNDTYRVTYDYEVSSGQFDTVFHGLDAGSNLTGSGRNVVDLIPTASTNIFFRADGAATYFLDNVSVRKVGELDAQIAGTTALAQAGLRGTDEAFLFDGATSRVTLNNRASIQGMNEFTLWMLHRPASTGENNNGTFFDKSSEFLFRFSTSGRDLTATVNHATTHASATTTTTVSLNEWHSLALTYSFSGDKLPHIYIDGVEAAYSGSPVAGVGARVSNTNHLIIGNRLALDRTLNGLVDEVLLADVALTPGELRQLHRLAGLN